MIDTQMKELARYCRIHGYGEPGKTDLPNGGVLVEIPGVSVEGWNRSTADVLFVAPPSYPAAQPDCFWVQPNGFCLANGGTPQNTNDQSQIPDDVKSGRRTTWFSWHVQRWNPSRDTLKTYFTVILDRLHPAR
ncbi:MAG: hypothetical protein F4181_10065 [Proteobacteria bacterium]|nr:hypothetical protein [Pseudomonadota bacterium]